MSNAKLDSHVKNELKGNNGAMMKIIKVQKDIFHDQEFSLNDYQSIVDRQDEIILHLEEANEETLAANRNLRVRVLELENLQKASDQKISSLEDCNLFLQIKINQLKSALNESVSNLRSVPTRTRPRDLLLSITAAFYPLNALCQHSSENFMPCVRGSRPLMS